MESISARVRRLQSVRRVLKPVADFLYLLPSLRCPGWLLQVNYCEEGSSFNHRLPGPKGERRVVFMNREDLDIDIIGCPKVRSNVDSGKGVRIQVIFQLC